jgi:putative hydroxymethylpyrimidine transport system substrate-binding protein
MRRVAALLAAALLAAAVAGCGGGGAEPGAPGGATLVLDFTPNAVHSGIYAAQRQGFYSDAGVDLTIHQPGESTDAPKLLAAGRTQFAILDIHDLGIARERGLDLVGLMPIVRVPLAAVIARGEGPVKRPRDLDGHTVGVTGLPSDEAVVDSEVSADGGDPAEVERVTIGFDAVASLAADKVDAATGFWNDEAVSLRRRGVPIRVFKVNEYGAPAYPELVLTTSRKMMREHPDLVRRMTFATSRGNSFASEHPGEALDDLLDAVPSLDRAEQAAEMKALHGAFGDEPWFGDRRVLEAWSRWDVAHGLLENPVDIGAAFNLENSGIQVHRVHRAGHFSGSFYGEG